MTVDRLDSNRLLYKSKNDELSVVIKKTPKLY